MNAIAHLEPDKETMSDNSKLRVTSSTALTMFNNNATLKQTPSKSVVNKRIDTGMPTTNTT